MKKLVLFLSACALLASAVWVDAAGDAGDPLASLSYLNGEFSQRAEKKIDFFLCTLGKFAVQVRKGCQRISRVPGGVDPDGRGQKCACG